ncbi:MAG: hydrolase, partial [Proteiniphilum sp.]|nr:hydrolase [Proteiniphilum sp.]
SGQMIEAAVMLYKITGDNQYLIDAQNTARGSYNYFTSMQKVGDSEYIFYNNSPWFNVILLRGLKALQLVDGNRTYIDTIRDNALYAWNNVRNEYGLFGNSWYSKADNNHKWLLDNACMIELFVELDEFIK